MSTNRENINKMSDKELSILLRYQCYIGQNGKIKTIPVEGIAGAPVEDTIAKYLNKKFDLTYLSEISDWLSQEKE